MKNKEIIRFIDETLNEYDSEKGLFRKLTAQFGLLWGDSSEMSQLRTLCETVKTANLEEDVSEENKLALRKLLENKNERGPLSLRLLFNLNFMLSTHEYISRLGISTPNKIEVALPVGEIPHVNTLDKRHFAMISTTGSSSALLHRREQHPLIFQRVFHNRFFEPLFRADVSAQRTRAQQQTPRPAEPNARDPWNPSAGG